MTLRRCGTGWSSTAMPSRNIPSGSCAKTIKSSCAEGQVLDCILKLKRRGRRRYNGHKVKAGHVWRSEKGFKRPLDPALAFMVEGNLYRIKKTLRKGEYHAEKYVGLPGGR